MLQFIKKHPMVWFWIACVCFIVEGVVVLSVLSSTEKIFVIMSSIFSPIGFFIGVFQPIAAIFSINKNKQRLVKALSAAILVQFIVITFYLTISMIQFTSYF